ncbi:hypothetical protein CFC21_091474, partial [Triticum aestivum]
LHLSADAPES